MAQTPAKDKHGGNAKKTKRGPLALFLDAIEWAGNKLPDPAVLFLIGLIAVWVLSAVLAQVEFPEKDPLTKAPIRVNNLMTPSSIAGFLSHMVETYTGFHPLGVVLVALLGVGVAERSGFLNTILKSMLNITPRALLTPMLIFVAIVSHTAADAGYVLVIPIGGVMFYAAGRHPLAGIAAAFAGVSGGFSANFIPSGIDPLLSGLTQEAVGIVDGTRSVNPLCNWAFTSASCLIIVGLGWLLTDLVIEPRLKGTAIDGDPAEMPSMAEVTQVEKRALTVALVALGLAIAGLFAWAYPTTSALRDRFGSLTNYKTDLVSAGMTFEENSLKVASIEPKGAAQFAGIKPGDTVTSVAGIPISTPDDWSKELSTLKAGKESPIGVSRDGELLTLSLAPDKQTIPGAPLILSIVPLIFLLFVIPGIAYGYTAGTFKNHRDVVKGMSKTMETMGYYLVLVFFTALFIEAFSSSNIGKLLAIKGANFLKDSHASPPVTILGIILFTALINLLVGSASAKWAMLSPIFVPMLMLLGISPELTQAAYRVGDSTTNIITPMMPYFPLVVVFCQRYVTNTGIGTVASMMLPYSVTFLVCWAIFLLGYWQLGIPLGIDAPYTYAVTQQ